MALPHRTTCVELRLSADSQSIEGVLRTHRVVGSSLGSVARVTDYQAELAKQIQQAVFQRHRVGGQRDVSANCRSVAEEIALEEGELLLRGQTEHDVGHTLL